MTSHGSIIYQESLASSVGTSMLITVPGMIVSTDPRRSTLHDWMLAHSKVVLSDGSPTRAARGDQCAGINTPDVSLVDTAMDHRLSLETIPELGSDHILLLLIWDEYIKVGVCPYQKTSQLLYCRLASCTNASITVSMRCYQSCPCLIVWGPSVA